MVKKYLVWIDVLGFDERAEEIAKYTHQRDSSKVRAEIIDTIRERIEEAQSKGEISGKAYENDKWILVMDSSSSIFKVITKILNHNTGYENYEKIPLEIAIGVEDYDEWSKFDGSALIFQKPTMDFLKTPIIDYYRKLYKKRHKESPKSTFVILTESMITELEPLDRKMCQRTEYKYEKDHETAVVTFLIADLDIVQRRGRVYEFLEKINRPDSKLYDRIDDLYVPPIEYEEIRKTLGLRRAVFITGTPEYGKTYSAIRLLWEYFDKGYEPVWIEGGEEWERWNVRRRLEEIERELNPHLIIYFEDPFGKTRYESRESLQREIGTIIDSINNVEDVYVIITSREEVFKRFEKEHLSLIETKNFEKRLNIKKPSYDYKRRKEMLLLWAESRNCKWFQKGNLRLILQRAIINRAKLPTPLSIKNFVISTTDISERGELIEKMEEKSKETAKSFADEIENMNYDKILFLSFIFIYKRIYLHLARALYERMVEELDIRSPLSFNEVLDWFRDDKIDIGRRRLTFSHPSYLEALDYLLVKRGSPTRLYRDIFSKVLHELSETKETQKTIPKFIASNFDILPDDVRNLLFELVKKERTVNVSLHCMMQIFEELPKTAGDILVKLAQKKETARAVGWALATNFNRLPEDLRSKLLPALLEMNEAKAPVARVIAERFDQLPEYSKELFKLAKDEEAVGHIIWCLVVNYDKLPGDFKDLLFKLAERKKTAGIVARAIACNFEKVDEKGKYLLSQLEDHIQQMLNDLASSGKKRHRRNALMIISKTKSQLSKEFASDILGKLVRDEKEKIRKKAQELMKELQENVHP